MTRDEAWKAIEREGRFAAMDLMICLFSTSLILGLDLHPALLLIPAFFLMAYFDCIRRAYLLSKEFFNEPEPESSDELHSLFDPSIRYPKVFISDDQTVQPWGPHVDRALSPQERRDD